MSFGAQAIRRIPGTRVPLQARHAILAAVVVVAMLFSGWYLAFHDVGVARADAHAYFGFLSLTQNHAGLRGLAQAITWLCLPGPYVVLASIPVLIALARRRWMLALSIAVMIPGAIITSETLKSLLAAPRPAFGLAHTGVGLGSWPSGHATASMTLGLALIIASAARWRPYAAVVGTSFGLAVTYAVLSLGWHYPSDAVAGFLVALIWTLLAMASVLAVDARYGRHLARLAIEPSSLLADMPAIRTMLGAAAIPLLAVAVWRGHSVLAFGTGHPAFVAATAAVALAGVLVPTALSVLLGGSDVGAEPRLQR